jgi:hypothetical protein
MTDPTPTDQPDEDGPSTGDDATSTVEGNLPDDDPRGNPAAPEDGDSVES